MKKNYSVKITSAMLMLSGFLMLCSNLHAQTIQTFTYTGVIQQFTVPTCVSAMTITAIGGAGAGGNGTAGGKGASMRGTFTCTPGQVLKILVGGQGVNFSINSSGGGGGSFVSDLGNVPWIVAGGGGGTNGLPLSGTQDATTTINGLNGNSASYPSNFGVGGVNGNGATSSLPCAGNGGGYYSNGILTSCCSAQGGFAYINGGAGAPGGCGFSSPGGFGGAGGGGNYGCGGGGGYSGGGANYHYPGNAGGGGSYNNGTNQVNTPGISTAQGTVVIAYDQGIPMTYSIAPSGGICAGGTATLTAVSGLASYTWSTGSNALTSTVSALSTSNYTVRGTNTNGCVSSAVITVSVISNPTITVNSGSICSGESFTILPSAAGAYTISGGSAIVAPSINNNYTVTTMNTAGCLGVAVSSITVWSLPVIGIPGPNGVCIGSTATLSAAGAISYTWSTGFSGVNLLVSPTVATTYTLIGKDANGCINSAQKTLAIYTLPSVNISGNSSFCQGASTSLLAGGNALTYSWSTGVTGNVLTVAPATSTFYLVKGFNANGCESSASITINVNPSPIVTANASTSNLCEGSSVILSGGGANTYTWSGGVGNFVLFYPSVTSTYTVTGTAANGCINSASITIVVNPLPAVTVTSSSQPLCPGFVATITANGANFYSWNTGNITPKIVVSPSVTTDYTVKATGVNGCTLAIVFNQVVTECMGINKQLNDPSVLIFPNPFTSELTITSKQENKALSVEIYNGHGQKIFDQRILTGSSNVDLNSYEKGIYFVKVYDGSKIIYQEKLVKIE